MKKAKVMNLVVLVLLLVLFSFSSIIEAKASGERYGGVLRIVYGDPINCIGYPGGIASFQEHQVAEPAVETLGRYDESGALVPYLAKDFELDADSLTLTIHLREGVKFHDGTICDAEAVKWNLEEFKASGRNEIDDVASIEVIDPLTLVLHLSRWNNSIAEAVLFTAGRIVSPTYFKTHGRDAAMANPVGTGPFKFVKWERDVRIVYEKNEDYRVAGQPYLDGIEIIFMPDTTTMISALRTGEIDVIATVDGAVADAMYLDGREPISRPLTSGTVMFGIIPTSNDPSLPFYDLRVRQAVAHAIDKKGIAELYSKQGWAYTNQWAPPGAWSYNEETVGYPYDVERAKELLAEAGYPNGFKTKGYVISGDVKLMEITQAFLKQVGIDMEIIPLESARENEMSGINGTWDGLFRWAGRGEADIAPVYARTFTKDGVRFVGGVLHLDDIKELIDAAISAKTFEEKVKISKELSRKVIDDYCLLIPYGSVSSQFFAVEKVHDTHLGWYHISTWTPEIAWVEK
ncbi:MAG TPA: ABC transporter substrate-binding protein [Mariniphaga sp.]|nr:ABC transporter substrate-binding protein [Mariniphaga sp.]